MHKLYPYQEEGVAKMVDQSGRVLLADQMGLGKTLQALAYTKGHTTGPVIVICPSSLKINWQREAAECGLESVVLKGRLPDSSLESKMYILNYDIVDAWKDELISKKPELLILDECHFVKSRSAKRTKACRAIAKKCEKMIAISGTPLTNKPAELWTTLNMLKPRDFSAFLGFARMFCKPRRTPWGMDYSGAANLDRLHKQLQTFMIRRLKEDVLTDLPEKTYNLVPLPIDDMEEYEAAARDYLGYLRGVDANAARKAARKEAISKTNGLKRLAANLKKPYLFKYFDDVLENKDKIVISCIHHHMIDDLMAYFKDKGMNPVKIDGRDKMTNRQGAVDTFQNDKSCRVFVGQLKAAGAGITLTAASDVYFAEIGWVPGEHAQMSDRVHRIGQRNACTANFLVAADTIEESFVKVLQKKMEVIGQVLDGTAEVEGSNLYDLLMEEITSHVKS